MKRKKVYLLIVLSLGSMSSSTAQTGINQQEAARTHHMIVPLMPEKIPKDFKRGFETVSGDPDKPGEPFVIRIYNVDNQVVPPHWHPEDEHITVVKGTWYIGDGDTFNRTGLREMNVGDYVLVPKQMRHFAWSKGATVVQIHGIGPFKMNLADPWMLLSNDKAAAHFKFKMNDRVTSTKGEGIIVFGAYSEKNKITQYMIAKNDGDAFAEFEENLEKKR
jgi:hypothetical protein